MTAFIQELVTHATGMDSNAMEAWYKLDSATCCATLRATAFWKHASEADKDSIADALGISGPLPNRDAWPEYMPQAIRDDFIAAFNRGMERMAR